MPTYQRHAPTRGALCQHVHRPTTAIPHATGTTAVPTRPPPAATTPARAGPPGPAAVPAPTGPTLGPPKTVPMTPEQYQQAVDLWTTLIARWLTQHPHPSQDD